MRLQRSTYLRLAWWRVCKLISIERSSIEYTNSVQQAKPKSKTKNHPKNILFVVQSIRVRCRLLSHATLDACPSFPFAVVVVVFIHLQFHPYTTIFHAQPKTLTSVHVPLQRVHSSMCCRCRRRRCCTTMYYVPVPATTVTSIRILFLFSFSRLVCFVFVVVISRFVNAFVLHSLVPLLFPFLPYVEGTLHSHRMRCYEWSHSKNSAHSVTTIEFFFSGSDSPLEWSQ